MTNVSKWNRFKDAISIVSSVYFLMLLVGLLVSIVVQLMPMLENPLVTEMARYFAVFFGSVLVSYIIVSHKEKRTRSWLANSNSDLLHYVDCLNKVMVYDLRISHSLIVLTQETFSGRKGKLEHFDYALKQIEYKQEKLVEAEQFKNENFPKLFSLPTEGSVGVLVELAKMWDIPFEELAHYLCNKLGKKDARHLVKIEKILKCYGKEATSTWKVLFESDD